MEYIAINFIPYFEPELEPTIQIYKQWSSTRWTYELPPEFDEDIRDTAIVSVDISGTAAFMNVDSANILSIPDLSSLSVPVGEYIITIRITDGKDTVT